MHYGGDYNPEQWPEEVWVEDVERMQEAGVTMVSLGIFAWSRIQPAEGEFDFGWLDRIITLLHDGGIAVDLATATASPPPWMHERYPEMLPVTADGTVLGPGWRQHYAPSAPGWRDAFRQWLGTRYGAVDEINEAWGTNFWSQRYTSIDQVLPPRAAPYSHNPGQLLDFNRFTSDMLLECYLMEREIIRAGGATQPITTNFMGAFKPANYAQWAEHMDVITDDAYPDPNDPESFREAAFQRDLMRSLKPDTPWMLLEQASTALNWRPTNAPKAPGQMEALSWQCVGRGADGVMFFQWRQSKAGAEKFHSAMLPHAGTDTRTWREITRLGAGFASLPQLPAGQAGARVALVFDWENWWAVENPDHPQNQLDYLDVIMRWYRALHRRHITVDIVPPHQVGEQHQLAIAPCLYLLDSNGADALAGFVAQGGHLLAGPFTDVVDDKDRFIDGGFLTRLGEVLGVGIEDFGALVVGDEHGEKEAPFTASFGSVTGTLFAEEVLLRGAQVEAAFSAGRREGDPALTRHVAGDGVGWYLATVPDESGCDAVVGHLLEQAGVEPVVAGLPATVDASRRGDVVTLVNFGTERVSVDIAGHDLLAQTDVSAVDLESYGVALVRQS